MDRFATLEPVKLYSSASKTGIKSAQHAPPLAIQKLVGRLPAELHLLVISNLPIPDIPAYARSSRALAAFVREDSGWEKRWKMLGIDKDPGLRKVMDELERKVHEEVNTSRAAAPPTISVDDEFGDFADGDSLSQPPADEMGDFVGAFNNVSLSATTPKYLSTAAPSSAKETFRTKFIRAFMLLQPLTRRLSSPPHVFLSELSNRVSSTLLQEAKTLRLLSYFLSPVVQPARQWESLYISLRTAMDRYDSNLLAAFDVADGNGDEIAMREAAESSWEVWDKATGDWEMGKVWAEKREIFYQHGTWHALDNFTKDSTLDFRAMDDFMEAMAEAIYDHGARAVRVFPPASRVILQFAERLANEVVGDYIMTLLTRAREVSIATYLKSAAASFREAWRIVDAILDVAKQRPDSDIPQSKAEDVIYQMFEQNMDEYLDEEVETVKRAFDQICQGWDREVISPSTHAPTTTKFLSSQNPALVKRNVLTSFTNLLLLPVTIVPKTVGAVGGAIMTGGSAAAQGIAMLNPQRWGGNVAVNDRENLGYSKNLDRDGAALFEVDEDDGEGGNHNGIENLQDTAPTTNGGPSPTQLTSASEKSDPSTQLDLLLSLDIALQLIHADRAALKRVETFAAYPGHYGHRVHDTIEELFILMLHALGDRHVTKGFTQATVRMRNYRPAEHTEMSNVAPLVQFFELVHLGDTIQSMVQVYFEKELAPHIDKTDFLNVVVREKKRFENSLDDCVALGLNAGTEVLMTQVEHIIITLTKAREYYPVEEAQLDLGPTEGCLKAIDCLESHCKLLKGSTSKEVLEVFYQEIGLRLIGIIQKHLKRQIISLTGGFQVIADLNAYNAFITSLKIPSISADFANLKMLGHVYVVEDAKDLAQIVRDVTRYGGAYRPEDVYEFIQRRSDWKKIEKIVDKTMYNLSFKEDCIIG